MISGAWKWIKDNKWKTLAAGAAIGGYLWYRQTETSNHKDQMHKQKMTTYWKDSQLAADRTISQFLPVLAKHTEMQTRLQEIVSALRNPENSPQDKARLFKELKTAAFSSQLVYMYSVVFVAHYMRIAVNVVGRHLFSATTPLDEPSAIDMARMMLPKTGIFGMLAGSDERATATGRPTDLASMVMGFAQPDMSTGGISIERKVDDPSVLEITPEVRDRCLGSTQYFLTTGLPILADIVHQACIGTLENHTLEEIWSLDDLINVFIHIRNIVEAQFWRPYEGRHCSLMETLLLPSEDTSPYPFSDPEEAIFTTGLEPEDKLRLLMNEKRNVVNSTAFQSLFQHSLNVAFASLSETMASSFPVPAPSTSPNNSQDSSSSPSSNSSVLVAQVSLPKILLALSKHFKIIIDKEDNIMVDRLTGSNEINEFSFRVFYGPKRN